MKNPYTPAHIVSMAHGNIKKCGLYQDYCREWSQKPSLKKTWRNFKAHFARAFKETWRSSRTSKTKGYAANVKSAQANAALFTKMQQDHTLALANLSTTTQADRTSVALSTKRIAELSTQVSILTAKLATKHSKKARLKKPGYHLAPAENGHRASSNKNPSDKSLLWNRNVYSHSGHKFDPNGYCSYHRFKLQESHTSATFRCLGDGHNKLATRIDTKGGNTWNKEWIKGGPTKWGGAGLDNNIFNINENYINYIKSNPKLVQTVDELAAADTGKTWNYPTFDFPCDNIQLAIIPLPIFMPNG